MQKNDLAKEIEEAEIIINRAILMFEDASFVPDSLKKVQTTLQRAREALSWIPVDRLPERDGYYLVTYKNLAPAEICDYEVKHGFNCTSYNPVIAWKQCPHAYTPEES